MWVIAVHFHKASLSAFALSETKLSPNILDPEVEFPHSTLYRRARDCSRHGGRRSIHTYIHTYIHFFCTYVHARAPKAQVRYCNDYATMLQCDNATMLRCYNAISSHCLYVTSSSWTELTLRRVRQLYVSSLPREFMYVALPHLNSDIKVLDVANLQLHTLTN